MKKFLLLLALIPAGFIASAQEQVQMVSPISHPRKLVEPKSPVLTNNTNPSANHKSGSAAGQSNPNQLKSLRSLSSGIKLNEQRIGSAGNLLTVSESGCDQLSTDMTSNSVVFIHREDNYAFPLTNLAEYGYDISKDGGNTWEPNIGPITVNARIDNNNVNGRFPQGVVYNPSGSTIADSTYLVYSGTWHDDCSSCQESASHWVGQMRGTAQLDSNANTYTVSIDTVNHGLVSIATGFCQGAPGVFWNINEANSGNLSSSDDIYGLIVEKGIWNQATKTVSWNDMLIPQQFDSSTGTAGIASVATAFNIAFDPSGKYGWIACLGDISTAPADSVYSPIFWYSVDSGNHWSGPQQLSLDSLPGVVGRLNHFPFPDYVQNAMSGVPTTSFEAKLVVDYLGNPHLFTTVGNGSAYSIAEGGGYMAYDINLNPARPACDSNWHGWAATLVDSVYTLVGTYTTDGEIEYNRPLTSTSADGKKLFFYWLDTDTGETLGLDTNEYPNLFTRAFDLVAHSSTPSFNLTQGDSLFGGSTVLYPNGGLFLPGANYPVVANTAIQNGTNYNVGLVLTQIDYENFPDGGSIGAYANPCAFWYVNNITYSLTDFSNGLAANVQVIGADTVVVMLGNSYVDSGAIIIYNDTSCFSVGQLILVTDSSNLNIGQTGTYVIYYVAEDTAGVVYGSASRTVQVVAAPVADFTYSIPSPVSNPGYLAFQDLSTNQPTNWAWDFGDTASIHNTSNAQNPSHQFIHNNTYNVCLTASNNWGSSQKCKSINVTTAINNVDLSQHVSLFPNPSTGKVFISVDASVTTDYTVSIYDMLGNAVINPVEHKSGAANLEMDLALLANGTYVVKIQTNSEMAVKQLELIRK